MTDKTPNPIFQGSLFEEDYLVRTLGALVHSPEIALTELVANAWDAGATLVDIFIPEDYGQKLIVEDNGTGLTRDQFEQRWMKLGYNRIRHQGKNVIFPPNVEGKRLAYGRNGVGRHGLLCFDKEYTVITNSGGKKSIFVITTQNESHPFVIKDAHFDISSTFGTRLEVTVTRNLPSPDKILQIISARFLHDPKFIVSINRQTVQLEQHSGLIDSTDIKIGDINLTAHFIDSQKSARSTLYQGIAFWQSNRLVGEPSWILGNEVVIDGRTKFAKQYTVVLQTNDLAEYIYEDWTGFKKVEVMESVYKEVISYVNKMFSEIAKDTIEETKQQIKSDFHSELSQLTPLAKYEVNEAIESITISHPTAKPESISIAVEAIINLEKTRTGKELLVKLAKLSEDDINGLNSLLEKWSVRDALSVLDEIDNRISVIEAIRKLSKDKDVDELHVLHPLVTGARWLFGPEFESAEYSSNRQLQTAVEAVFKKKIGTDVFNNHKKRPDIVVLNNSTASITGTESFDSDSNLATVNKVLVIELKRGGFKLTREERNQAQGYVEEFMNCGNLIGSPYIEAFVVGESFSEKIQPIAKVLNGNSVEMGKIRITTFGQLVDTAEKRLFGLRQKLSERYDDVPGMDLFKQQTKQLKVDFVSSETKEVLHQIRK
ncbi:ATP-binding protein [Taibaiella sp. KBW10]|uniref:ATP-binding protein n=1 Tax=Taibaiella sp. KBW10 TaxID=2153357 RepID=UPI000F5AE705|nr:ATP-binding protein [Taibaiella sp. KBW10]RQO30398.1 ATP-binding protein [Taibaiella sp. KBW10]